MLCEWSERKTGIMKALEETDFMVTQFASPSKKQLGGHLPYVFTEHGVVMLAGVLNSKRAIEMNIIIHD